MMIVGSCVSGDGTRYRSVALPSIEDALGEHDVVRSVPGDRRGITAVYNDFIAEARRRDDCEALVLVHDDVEILDPNFRAKVVEAAGEEGLGVVGVIGGADLSSIEWWKARRTEGRVFETRGRLDFGRTVADVDVVDGLMLILTRRAFEVISFDEVNFPRFHGYDIDYCLQVRDADLRVVVRPIEVIHRTIGGYGDTDVFDRADRALAQKWPHRIHARTVTEASRDAGLASARFVLRQGKRARHLAGRIRVVTRRSAAEGNEVTTTEPTEPPVALECFACGSSIDVGSAQPGRTSILACDECGAGITWPPPTRDGSADGIWLEQYNSNRLTRRETWLSEARQRVEWLQLYLAEGALLEVGCGTGEFVRVAADEGFDAAGIEPSEWAAAEAVALGVRVHRGFVDEWRSKNPGHHFDAIAMWHALERVPDPLSVLTDTVSMLRPGGFMFIEVPNFESSDAARLGLEWSGAQPSDHFHHFTPRALTQVFERSGAEVVQILPMTSRLYGTRQCWERQHNRALVEGSAWPPLDLLRAVARRPC